MSMYPYRAPAYNDRCPTCFHHACPWTGWGEHMVWDCTKCDTCRLVEPEPESLGVLGQLASVFGTYPSTVLWSNPKLEENPVKTLYAVGPTQQETENQLKAAHDESYDEGWHDGWHAGYDQALADVTDAS